MLDAARERLPLAVAMLERASVALKGGSLVVEFDPGDAFNARKLSGDAERREFFGICLETAFGRRPPVDFVVADGAGGSRKRSHEELIKDPYVKQVIEVFGAQIVDVRDPDTGGQK